jgi:hypothetical protein
MTYQTDEKHLTIFTEYVVGVVNNLTAQQLRALMSAHFSTSFFGNWQLQRFVSVVSV